MSLIDQTILSDNTKLLFNTLSSSPELSSFTLVGGTALALQIQHRLSLDFDFACYSQKLPEQQIDDFIYRLKNEGQTIHELTDVTSISQFKISTGNDLRQFSRDYIIDDIKVTFFVHGKTQQQREFYSRCEKIKTKNTHFSILRIDGLKVAKILVLANKVRSRDLFDLMILFKEHSLTLDKLELFVKTMGHIDDPEHYRAILTGIIPLDRNDEGLKSVNIDFDIKIIYQFFDNLYREQDIKKTIDLYTRK